MSNETNRLSPCTEGLAVRIQPGTSQHRTMTYGALPRVQPQQSRSVQPVRRDFVTVAKSTKK